MLKNGMAGAYSKFVKVPDSQSFSNIQDFVAAYTCKSLDLTAIVVASYLPVGVKVLTCELVNDRVVFTGLGKEEVVSYPYKANSTWWDLMMRLQEDLVGGFLGKSTQLSIVVGQEQLMEGQWHEPIKFFLGQQERKVPKSKAPSSRKAAAKPKNEKKVVMKSPVMKRPSGK